MKNLIDRDELLSFLDDRAGFYDFIEDLAKEYSDYNMTSLLEFAEEIMDVFTNVIKSAEVVEEREEAKCLRHYDKEGDRYIYICDKCLEDITTPYGCEEFKFCPNCGAKYVELIKEKELCGMI